MPINVGQMPPELLKALMENPDLGKQIASTAVDFSPLGDAKALAYDLPRELRQGNYGDAALSAVSAVPVAGMFADAIKKGIDAAQAASDALKADPKASLAQKTQISTTTPSYVKAGEVLKELGVKGQTLDYGAGLGEGAKAYGATHTFEPFPQKGFEPTFMDPKDIPAKSYDGITNLNVLNVVPKEMRDTIVLGIGRALAPGGKAVITTRGRDVMDALKTKGSKAGPEEMSVITSTGTFQKGFKQRELEDYVKGVLGDLYTVEKLPKKIGQAGILVTKNK